MTATDALPEAVPDKGQESVEVRPLLPTPERLSQLLEMDRKDVEAMYISAEARGKLVDTIMEHKEELKADHNNIYRGEMEELIRVGAERLANDPDISMELLDETLQEVQKTLAAKRDFLLETSPDNLPDDEKQELLSRLEESEGEAKTEEERSLWRKAWDAVTWLPRKHPVITLLLALAAAAWGIYYFWDQLAALIAIPNPAKGAAEVAREIAAPTGGEVVGIPQGALPGPTAPPVDIPLPQGGGVSPGEIVPDLAGGTAVPPNIPAGSMPAPSGIPETLPPVESAPLPTSGPPPLDPGETPEEMLEWFKDRPF